MKAIELRIGNWIKHLTKEEKVWSTQSPDGINSMPEGWYEPIPLTQEWLVKFGFKKTFDCSDGRKEYSLHRSPMILYYSPKGKNAIEGISEGVYNVKIKYVHQLQNLYFSLTGKELLIKIK